MSTDRERWAFTIELPAGIDHGGRFVARLLKHLLRSWGVRATAVLDAPAVAQDARGHGKATISPSANPDAPDAHQGA